FTQRIRRRCAGTVGGGGRGIASGRGRRGVPSSSPASADTSGGLLRGKLGGQSGDDDDLAFHIEAFVRIDIRLVDDVAVAGEDQVAGDVERFERRGAPAAGVDRPVLGVFEVGGSRRRSRSSSTTCPASASSAATASAAEGGGRRRNRRLALAGHDLFADQ